MSLDKIDKNFKTPVTIGVSRTGPGVIRYRLTLVDQAGHDAVSVAVTQKETFEQAGHV